MIGFTRLRFGDFIWRVRNDAASWLFDSRGLRLSSWLESGQASVVKHGPHRTVYRVQLDGRTIYVKHHRVADTRAMISQWLQSSKGRREWETAVETSEYRLPTPVPLALGESRRAGLVFENFLVTEGIEQVQPLDQFVQNTFPRLPASRQSRVRRQLALELAELIARLHESGVLHPDLHAGNVLIRLADDDTIALFLIDLEEARASRRASWRRSRENLLAFGVFFQTMARGTDRARFLRRYLECRPQLDRPWRDVASDVQHALRRRANSRWRQLSQRCVENNRRFMYRNIGSAHGHAVTELGEQTLLALLRDPDAPFRCRAAETLKQSASGSVVWLEMNVGGRTMPVVYKRFRCAKWLDPLRATIADSPALRAWRGGYGLLVRRLPTPRPLAVIERIRWPMIRETYLLTEAIPDSMSLREYLRNVVSQLPPEAQRRRMQCIVEQLGRLVRRMHTCNLSHRDLKASNFLVTPAHPEAESPTLHIIDLVGLQSWRKLPAIRWLQNIARVLVSLASYPAIRRTDLLRFLRAYDPRAACDRHQSRELWQQLQAIMVKKRERNRRLKRPIA
jgi:tRNA A-37 threonylcarbamoyl transferase component Bud32